MSYQPKSTAPASFDLASAFTALITGDTTWGWLLNWLPILGEQRLTTAQFCSAGPVSADPLSPGDFNTGSRSPLGELANTLLLAVKLRNVAYDRVFGAYCEIPAVPAGSPTTCFTAARVLNGTEGNATIGSGTLPASGDVDLSVRTYWTSGNDQMFVGFQYQDGGGVWQDLYNTTSFQHGWPVGTPFIAHSAGSTAWWGRPWRLILSCHNPGDIGFEVSWTGLCAGSPTPFIPTPQPQPTGVLAPATKTYATIADLGAELDALELKSDFIHNAVQYLAGVTAPPQQIADSAVAAPSGSPIDLTGAVGFIVDVSGIPAGTDELFGDPRKYHRLGRVNVGSDLGWFPAIDLSVTPMVISPLPPGAKKCQVVVNPPATATVTILRPPK